MTNNAFINEKRESLTQFVREQMIGPGAYGYKFGMDGEETVDILDVTPGSIYCSGILFPKKTKASESTDDSIPESAASEEETGETTIHHEDLDDDEPSLYDEEDIKQLTQRFPDSFGISCCLGKNRLSCKDFSIHISGRFYTKIGTKNLSKVFVKVEAEDIEGVKALMSVATPVPNEDGS